MAGVASMNCTADDAEGSQGTGGPSDCVSDTPCANHDDCAAGTRCNTAVSPPVCQVLYCAANDDPCSDDVLCAEGLYCHDSVCAIEADPFAPCTDGACETADGICASFEDEAGTYDVCVHPCSSCDGACVGTGLGDACVLSCDPAAMDCPSGMTCRPTCDGCDAWMCYWPQSDVICTPSLLPCSAAAECCDDLQCVAGSCGVCIAEEQLCTLGAGEPCCDGLTCTELNMPVMGSFCV
jgi:hypothetical protein